jgi:hypothetical protein
LLASQETQRRNSDLIPTCQPAADRQVSIDVRVVHNLVQAQHPRLEITIGRQETLLNVVEQPMGSLRVARCAQRPGAFVESSQVGISNPGPVTIRTLLL